jgi:glutathione S-transferase
MIIYGSSLSPYVRKVLACAAEKGIEVELQPTGFPNPSAEFLEASPFRKMPALRDGDYTLADIAVASPFANFRHTRTRVDPERYPRTVAYVERILARPSLSTSIQRETEFLANQAA